MRHKSGSALLILLLLAAMPAKAAVRVEFGPLLAFPVPSADVGNAELGIDTGATVTVMDKPGAGVGIDLIYHQWPTSADFKSEFDKSLIFLKIDSETWSIRTLQATAHVKLLAPSVAGTVPWFQAGIGLYRLDPNLIAPTGDRLKATNETGAYGSLGFDHVASPGLRLGLDATYHHLWVKSSFGSDFSALSIGAHVLFGR
jgi:hypothetical protein